MEFPKSPIILHTALRQLTTHIERNNIRHRMPECQVHDCRLRRGRGDGKGISFFRIPDGSKPEYREIAQKWLHFCGTGHDVKTFKFTREKIVCENHFTPDCFVDDFHSKMARMRGEEPKHKALRADAVPTVVSHRRQTYDPDRAERAKKRSDKKVSSEITSWGYYDGWMPEWMCYQQYIWDPWVPFDKHGIILIPACITNHTQGEVGAKITYTFPNFSGVCHWSLGRDEWIYHTLLDIWHLTHCWWFQSSSIKEAQVVISHEPLFLTWINHNLSMDK